MTLQSPCPIIGSKPHNRQAKPTLLLHGAATSSKDKRPRVIVEPGPHHNHRIVLCTSAVHPHPQAFFEPSFTIGMPRPVHLPASVFVSVSSCPSL